MLGGYQAPSPYDPLFEKRDGEGQFNTRLDVISALADWWDPDQQRTQFDPGASTVTSGGGEDEIYRRYRDPYVIKNAPFDSLEEVRLVRGVTDDFWATFVQPDPDDLRSERLTIYGSGAVNPNEAPPEVMLARLCSFRGLTDQPLCSDPLEAAKFIQLVRTVRSIFPVPFFTRSGDFLNFVEGRGGGTDLYPLLLGMLGPTSPLVFRPVTIPADVRTAVDNAFVTAARILTIRGEGRVGRARVRIRTVANFHDRWTPPPPNAGSMPALGVFHYYRVD
jgi:general secretion pathway protein K